MNIKYASFAAIAAVTATVSLGANAGELYGTIETDLNNPANWHVAQAVNTGLSVDGILYAEVDAALDAPAPTMTAGKPYVTSLAVGGELGYPVDSPRQPAGSLERSTNFAE